MSNDDFEWLERYSQPVPLRYPQQYQYGVSLSSSSSQGPPAPPLLYPPMSTSQAPTGHTHPVYTYSAPYIPPQTYVRPQDTTHYSRLYPPTAYREHQPYQVNSSATAPPLASVPTPTPTPPAPGPPPAASASAPPSRAPPSAPIATTQKPPTDTTREEKEKPLVYHNSPIYAYATSADPETLGHDVKRRRVESPVAMTTPKPTVAVQGSLSHYSFKPQNTTSRSHLRMRTDLAQRLNEADTAEKVTYDPKTIARDILIASGRHPTELPLNHHLVRLREVFSGLETASDLATFRWDVVDPPKPSVNTIDRSRDHAPLPAAPPAETRPVQSNPLHRPRVPYPPQQPAHYQHSQRYQQHSQPQSYQQPQQPPHRAQTTHLPQSQPQQRSQLHSSPQIHIPPQPQPRRQPSVPQVQLPSKPQSPAQPQSQPQSHTRPAAQTATKPQAPSQPKHSTRPSSNMVGKRGPGRPPASSKVEVTVPISSQIPYQVYACDWKDCQAELHNLEMLKKHIFKVHVPYALTCQWKDCKFQEPLPAIHLYKHALTAHVESIAWKLGDGPSVPGTEGRDASATPGPKTIPDSIQPGGEDSLIFPASYSSIRAFNRVHGNHTQTQKAREILKAVRRLKEHIGFGLDPGGCELATPARNKRVSNDEDFYAVRHES
ncbi:putative C2H2 finger domain protein [Aspergillus clavatus NRRL 1]|uniref:C2H2-type domain-containing protein n=1 Tax=Aspergillus clavatus (strain ATCC 1007 / CBS 513.65 / DSM 816 / NCTC 3887 / NRRL 1 / QM 1276 / 107) TaxID=344612 RepID=A1CU10_ASPCL|nr:uncharacterized protein ACLA_084920 [Aspergillus clavatus NRRL 1]EAW06797.1 hypothetical protein ACLA_084920 [Aspergillus clavatus NRRL 1]